MSFYRLPIRLLLLGFLLVGQTTYSQVTIDLPIANSVTQRSNSNTANVTITGSYTSGVVSAVEAKLFYPGGESTVEGFDWTLIDSAPSKGHYYGTLANVPGGSYVLKVRVKKTTITLSESAGRVIGVGDVFLAFGQSNAQGLRGFGEVSASSPLVITHSFIDSCTVNTPALPSFSQINTGGNLGQHGIGSWYWGKVGDNLVSVKGVPVAIFNAAISGAALHNFLDSRGGGTTTHPIIGGTYCVPNVNPVNPANPTGAGTPYIIFRKTINYYNSLYGIRAILFMQGESDNYINTSQTDYQNRLNTLIGHSRADFGANVPWVVSRTSFYDTQSSDANIINAQNAVVNPGSQIFYGPATDGIVGAGKRDDDVHFNGTGLTDVADLWRDALITDSYNGQSFYDLSTPIPAKTQPNITVTINGSNVTLTAPGGYSSYKWVAGDNFNDIQISTSSAITQSSGSYRCYMSDAVGNLVVSKKMNVSDILTQQSLSTAFSDSLFLSDYTPYSVQNGLGPIAYDQRAGGSGDNDGGSMNLDGITYAKGLGVHSGSSITFNLNTGFHRFFKATIGIDDAVASGASVQFKVYGNNTLLYTSGTKTQATASENISVLIAGYTTLRLEVTNVSGTLANNQANWANARIVYDKPVITVTDTLSKCIGISWTNANAGSGIVNYRLYKNGNLETTVPAATTTYTFTGLDRNTNYTVAVRGIDANGNETSLSSATVKTTLLFINYPNFNRVCVGTSNLPATLIPGGGTFALLSGGGISTLNTITGALTFSAEGSAQIQYSICGDLTTTTIFSFTQPQTPTLAASIDLINVGDSVTLTSSSCSPYTFLWSNSTTANPIKVSPADTTNYFVRCNNGGNCIGNSSNTLTLKVIPDCPDTFQLVSTTSDLNYGSESFNFFASDQIKAANKIYSPTGAVFRAGSSIELKPGFEARAGSVFSARILGCP